MAKIKYKASYTDPDQNPFKERLITPTITAEVNENVPLEEVERMARKAGEEKGYRLDKVEVVT